MVPFACGTTNALRLTRLSPNGSFLTAGRLTFLVENAGASCQSEYSLGTRAADSVTALFYQMVGLMLLLGLAVFVVCTWKLEQGQIEKSLSRTVQVP